MPKQAPPAETPQAETPPPTAPAGNRFFSWVRSLGLVREPGWIGGVSAGIAVRIGIDVVIVRGILVVVAVLGGPAVLLYALAWLLLPDDHDRIHLEDLLHGKVDSAVAAIAVLVALSLLPVTQGFWWFGSLYWGAPDWHDSVGRAVWTIVILGLLVWFAVWVARRAQRGSTPMTSPATTDDRPDTIPVVAQPARTAPLPSVVAPAPPNVAPGPDAGSDEVAAWRANQAQWKVDHDAFLQQQAAERQAVNSAAAAAARAERVARALDYREERARNRSNPLYSLALVGVALVAGAITALVLGAGSPTPIQFLIGTALAVGILGIGIIINGALGRRGGGATAVAVLLMLPLALAGIFPQSGTLKYSGDWTVVAHGGVGSTSHYELGSGNLTLDARTYFATPRPATGLDRGGSSISVYVGSGTVRILVPNDEYVEVSRHVIAGSHAGGSYHDYYLGTDRADKNEVRNIYIEAVVGTGRIIVVREPTSTGVPAS